QVRLGASRANGGGRSRGAGSYDGAGRGNADVAEMAVSKQQDGRRNCRRNQPGLRSGGSR
ncbi:hypothetical protein AMECASPLE_026132, partial [Ameca splendens]